MQITRRFGRTILYGIEWSPFPYPYIKIAKGEEPLWLHWFINRYMDGVTVNVEGVASWGIHSALFDVPNHELIRIEIDAIHEYNNELLDQYGVCIYSAADIIRIGLSRYLENHHPSVRRWRAGLGQEQVLQVTNNPTEGSRVMPGLPSYPEPINFTNVTPREEEIISSTAIEIMLNPQTPATRGLLIAAQSPSPTVEVTNRRDREASSFVITPETLIEIKPRFPVSITQNGKKLPEDKHRMRCRLKLVSYEGYKCVNSIAKPKYEFNRK